MEQRQEGDRSVSVTDPSADPVQPESGQGESGTSDAPYSEYLNRIPEEVRGEVEPVFKDWDANVTRRFQEHSQYRSQWEPYEQAGVSQHTPEDLQWALQVSQAARENPQALREWLDQQYGPAAAPETAQQPPPAEDPYGFPDPAQQLEQLLSKQLGPVQQQVEQFTQWREQFEQKAHEAQIQDQLGQQVAALKAEHGESLPEEMRDKFDSLIETFAMKYAEPGADPKTVIDRAWGDFQAWSNAIEKAALQAKVDAPAPAERGGVPDVSPDKISNIMDAAPAALEFLRSSNRA